MSTQDSTPDIHVEDDEGSVDHKTKTQILNLRSQVDQDERELYVNRMSDPQTRISIAECNQYWGVSVRQYLRAVKRLWNDDDTASVDHVQKYWEELPIGRETMFPPDKNGYEFSLIQHTDGMSESMVKRQIGLPRGADLPQPRTVEFRGLKSVLNTNRLEEVWVVKTDTRGPPPEHETLRVSVVQPVPKHILENAVEATDNFLQAVGVGLDITAEDYMADGEPGL